MDAMKESGREALLGRLWGVRKRLPGEVTMEPAGRGSRSWPGGAVGEKGEIKFLA